jgi:single-strand DNA-binding protein
MKKITIIGNITRDAEIRDFSNRKAINFSVAVNESYKDSNGTKVEKSSFFNCTLWRENTTIATYLKKGVKVYIEGDNFDSEYYQNKEGEIKSSIKITVNRLELLSTSQNQTQQTQPAQTQQKPAQQNQGYNQNTISSSAFSDDDLPF